MLSRFSRLTPRLSGSRANDTTTTSRVHEPNKKYGPELDLERKRGVVNAIKKKERIIVDNR